MKQRFFDDKKNTGGLRFLNANDAQKNGGLKLFIYLIKNTTILEVYIYIYTWLYWVIWLFWFVSAADRGAIQQPTDDGCVVVGSSRRSGCFAGCLFGLKKFGAKINF